MVPAGTLLSYVTIALSIFGVGGLYTCNMVLIMEVLTPEQLSGTLILIKTFGTGLSLAAPMVVILPQPYPFYCFGAFITLGLVCCSLIQLHTFGAPDKKISALRKGK